jgi:ATP sulfurylase
MTATLPIADSAPPIHADLPPPHGGVLVDRFVPPREVMAFFDRATRLPAIALDAREVADLELVATGAASPLTGFLGAADHRSVLERLRLADGTVWPLPLSLTVTDDEARHLAAGAEAALRDEGGRLLGTIHVEEIFSRDPLAEAQALHGTTDPAHPGVARLLSRPRALAGGSVRMLPLPETLPFAEHRYTPRELRQEIRRRGWGAVGALGSREPLHRGDEDLVGAALAQLDGVVVHPFSDATDGDAVSPAVRFRCYEATVGRHLPRQRTLLAALPGAGRHGGARETLFWALVRKSYGIGVAIVGAGRGAPDGAPGGAAELFARFTADELGVRVLALPQPVSWRAGLPPELLRPEVAALLRGAGIGREPRR